MKLLLLVLMVIAVPFQTFGQSSSSKPTLPPHPNAPATEELQTEKVVAPGQPQVNPPAHPGANGLLDSSQIKSLTHKIWLAQYHLTDLLTQVQPDRWRIPAWTRQSFDQSIDSLQKSVAAEENWRGQFEARPESLSWDSKLTWR